MSYNTIFQSSNDTTLIGRITAAAAAEGSETPESTASVIRWPVVSASDIAAAYASAIAANNPNPGGDESVITDQMILSAVQANMPPET